ncbi:DNA processing protein [Amphibacillus xylanus NBRC 15112]|uniref:DNA processing protein n=1 Tax=Amphibacillus xylanus (strain ATCC 51415 / DSM 6626 / JCM 7361 / LMG 17667 / NBRC 15112 / Ep01) TaxID=698758 RepID=K0J4J7_AMPXN|nr:DNA-processing protein DprA [Amphibacillus xylanus]BAM47646.1 DNA processing protein [Amphibacillus xylanus NBRC 15112]
MNLPRLRLIYLAQFPQITRSLMYRMIKKDVTLSTIYQYSINDLVDQCHCPLKTAKQLHQYLSEFEPNHNNLKKLHHYKIWTIFDEDYPRLLKNIPDPPIILYGLGRSDYINHLPALAVVGTRRPSKFAKKNMYDLLAPLVNKDWLFVSGMAAGIDGYAHRIADYYGGKTIAVIAGGLNHPYPSEHLDLFQRLSKKHLVISEYPPHTRPERYHFPERNRIISGLAFATLVIEAQERSGSLITADQALEQGREVLAVPNAISLEQAKGCHYLIQNGAKLVQSTYDILQEWDELKQNWLHL